MTKQIPLHGKYGEGKFALVDDADFEWLSQYRWRGMKAARTVYAVATIDRRPVLMHRMIMDAPKKMTVDHIDHCGFNNQRGNLRLATNAENSRNRSTVIGKSQCRGVFWSTARRLWMAAIKINDKTINLGTFASERDAAIAYDTAAQTYFGEFAYTNKAAGLLDKAGGKVYRRAKPAGASGYRGVYQSGGGRWTANIGVDHRRISLGSFDLPEDAARAYDAAAVRYYGDLAFLNFPEDYRGAA